MASGLNGTATLMPGTRIVAFFMGYHLWSCASELGAYVYYDRRPPADNAPSGSALPGAFGKLFEPGLRSTRPLHPDCDGLQRLTALAPKLRYLGLKYADRVLGFRTLDPFLLKLLFGLCQGGSRRLALGLDPRQLRFEPSDLLVLLRPEFSCSARSRWNA